MEVSLQQVYRYVGFIHLRPEYFESFTPGFSEDGVENCDTPVEEWLNNRFEVFVTHSAENASSGLHMQWYGETRRPWDKRDTNAMGVKGVLGKYMPLSMRVDKAKRWSKQVAKKDRETNCAYVAKGGVKVYMSDGDPQDYVGRWKERSRKKSETFHELLLRLWKEGDSPTDHKEIYDLLVKSRAIPWNNFGPTMLWRASDWLINQCNMESSVYMMDLMYEEQRRRMIGN